MTANRVAPWLDDGDLRLYHGDALAILQALPAGIAQTCVTSPPYWGLRDYGTGQWTGGDEACDHREAGTDRGARTELPNPPAGWAERAQGAPHSATCRRCGSQRVDSQLGLEATPHEYVENMVALFREVWRVLRPDGTLWLNLGDSYAGGNYRSGHDQTDISAKQASNAGTSARLGQARVIPPGTKHKDLIGIPWRVAFALQADGWYLRSDIIWSKPNPMPESVTDRPTKAHEYLFLFSKQPRYYFDQDAIREPSDDKQGRVIPDGHEATWVQAMNGQHATGRIDDDGGKFYGAPAAGRNRRSVWTIPTQPFPEAHFATYPEELVRPCILAGTSEKGECVECGAPWTRQTDTTLVRTRHRDGSPKGNRVAVYDARDVAGHAGNDQGSNRARDGHISGWANHVETTGWAPSCSCNGMPRSDQWGAVHPSPPETQPQLVLDPFIGSGTTALVARKHGRRSIGIDLSLEYLELAAKRTQQLSLLGGVA